MSSILVSGDPIVSTESVKGFDNIGFLVFNDAAKPGVDAIANTAYRLLPLPQISDPGQYSVAGAIAEVELSSRPHSAPRRSPGQLGDGDR